MRAIALPAALLLFGLSAANAACPNQSTTLTIPMSGEATMTFYETTDALCTALAGPFTFVMGSGILAVPMNAATKPAVTVDAAGVAHFTANGAAFGTVLPLAVTFTPAGKVYNLTSMTVGGPVNSFVGGTTSP